MNTLLSLFIFIIKTKLQEIFNKLTISKRLIKGNKMFSRELFIESIE